MGSLLKSSSSSSCNFNSVKMLSICSSWILIRHSHYSKKGLAVLAVPVGPCAITSWRNIYFMISNTYTPWYLVLGELNLVLKNACCLRLQIETTATLKEIRHQRGGLGRKKLFTKRIQQQAGHVSHQTRPQLLTPPCKRPSFCLPVIL